MTGIIITSIICLSLIIIIGIICYTNYKKENDDILKTIHKRIDLIHSKINNHYDAWDSKTNSIKNLIIELTKHNTNG